MGSAIDVQYYRSPWSNSPIEYCIIYRELQRNEFCMAIDYIVGLWDWAGLSSKTNRVSNKLWQNGLAGPGRALEFRPVQTSGRHRYYLHRGRDLWTEARIDCCRDDVHEQHWRAVLCVTCIWVWGRVRVYLKVITHLPHDNMQDTPSSLAPWLKGWWRVTEYSPVCVLNVG